MAAAQQFARIILVVTSVYAMTGIRYKLMERSVEVGIFKLLHINSYFDEN